MRPVVAEDLAVDLVQPPRVRAERPLRITWCPDCGGRGELFVLLTLRPTVSRNDPPRRVARLDRCPRCGGEGTVAAL